MTPSSSSPPQFTSTRGGGAPVSFQEALLTGLAPDGGLYTPDALPPLASTGWDEVDRFPLLAHRVLAKWLGEEVPEDELAALLEEALSFPVPLVPLEEYGGAPTYVLELFHGPTLSFKDFGARTMARLMAYFMQARDETLTILVATSGDTGSAVADGFAGQENVRVVLLYPKDKVSPVQERQLIVRRPGVKTLAVEGSFDDCQRLVKAAFTDEGLEDVPLSSANSINVGRLLPQMLYYLWGVRQGGFEDVVYCVPSGNLGNLTAGVMAALAGLPVSRFVAAHNANDFFPQFLAGREEAFKPSVPTLSNAMDVGAPSNFERLEGLLGIEGMRRRIWSSSVSDDETLEAMRRVHDATGYVADPHTAVGLEAVQSYRRVTDDQTPIAVLSTAHPSKFPAIVEEALGFKPERPERLAALWDRETQAEPIAPDLSELRTRLRSYARA